MHLMKLIEKVKLHVVKKTATTKLFCRIQRATLKHLKFSFLIFINVVASYQIYEPGTNFILLLPLLYNNFSVACNAVEVFCLPLLYCFR